MKQYRVGAITYGFPWFSGQLTKNLSQVFLFLVKKKNALHFRVCEVLSHP